MKNVKVLYKCDECGAKGEIEVPGRHERETIEMWVEGNLKPWLSHHHKEHGGGCKALTLHNVHVRLPDRAPDDITQTGFAE